MKKLMIALAAVAMAAGAQAAAVTWSVNNIQASPDAAVNDGWIVQIFDAATTYDYEAARAGTITALSSSTAYQSGTIFKATASFGDYGPNTLVNIYAVIYDAASIDGAQNYIVSTQFSKSMPASGSPLSAAFGNMAGTTTGNLFKGQEWQSTGSVPEPTSAMLLLLGVAGLALRRKQA